MYLYDRLQENEKTLYDRMCGAFDRMEEYVEIGDLQVSEETLWKIRRILDMEHPEIFWVEIGYRYEVCGNIVQGFKPIYRMTMEERQKRHREILQREASFLTGIRFTSSPYEKALRLYENMPRLITYDRDATVGQRAEDRKKKLDDCSTIYGAIVLGRAVCGGYAKAFQYILKKLGVESLNIKGEILQGGRHAWNLLKLDDNWCHVDVTWGDGLKSFTEGYISYAWFGLPDYSVLRSRMPDDYEMLPRCVGNGCSYFIKKGRYLFMWNPEVLEKMLHAALEEKKCAKMQFRFSNKENMHRAWTYLLEDGKIFSLYREHGIWMESVCHIEDEETGVLIIWPGKYTMGPEYGYGLPAAVS